jgi:hypothetical protein
MSVQPFTPAGQVQGMPDGAAMLAAWAQTATSAAQLVGPLVETAFVPDHFRPKIDPRATDEEKAHARQVAIASATAAVLYGAEIGLSPMQALQGVIVIKGRVGMYAATMVALVQAAGHEVWTEDSTDTRVIVCGRRRGVSEVERQVWDIERARKAGYLSNEKYKTDPQAMLWARAASVVCRRIAQDVLKGITASTEEIQDDVTRELPRAATRTVQRAPQRPELAAAPAPTQHPTFARAVQAPAVPAPTGPPLPGEEDVYVPQPLEQAPAADAQIDAKQWASVNALFVTLGVTGPGQTEKRMTVISALAGRLIQRGGELTAAEGALIVDNLQANGRQVVHDVLSAQRQADAGLQAAQAARDLVPVDNTGLDAALAQAREGAPILPVDGDDQDDYDHDPSLEPGFGAGE